MKNGVLCNLILETNQGAWSYEAAILHAASLCHPMQESLIFNKVPVAVIRISVLSSDDGENMSLDR